MTEETKIEHYTPVEFTKVRLSGTHLGDNIAIENVTTDIDIFEHLDKPYLTAVLSFMDTGDIISGGYFIGNEKVEIELTTPPTGTDPDIVPNVINKTFIVSKIVSAVKVHDAAEHVVLHLIEEHAFVSQTELLNSKFEGPPAEIIRRMGKYINAKVDYDAKGAGSMRVIVPNLTPLNAMAWIKNRTSTNEGYPFYLYSTLIGDKLQFRDLKSLMSNKPINPKYPYAHITTDINVADAYTDTLRRRVIISYEHRNTDSVVEMIAKGIVGSYINYIDVTQGKTFRGEYNIHNDVMTQLIKDGFGNESLYNYRDAELHITRGKSITQIGGMKAFDGMKSYGEADDLANYKRGLITTAMDTVLKKAPLTLTVDFADFIKEPNVHNSIGNTLRVRFMRNLDTNELESLGDAGEDFYRYDPKKSGDFLIFATKHSFRRENYSATHSLVKVSEDAELPTG